MTEQSPTMLEMTTDLVASYLQHNRLPPTDLPALIAAIFDTLTGVGEVSSPDVETIAKPTAAQIRRSITDSHLISFEDNKPYKILKRHLTLRGLSVAEYREKWGLPADYPATAPAYSAARSAMAKAIGLGSTGRLAASTKSAKANSAARETKSNPVRLAKRTMKTTGQ